MAKSKRHTHKYHKVLMGYISVWTCALPNCLHYMPKHMEQMVLGKATYCWGCDTEMILTPQNMSDDKPLCVDCKKRQSNLIQSIQEDTLDVDTTTIEEILREKGL